MKNKTAAIIVSISFIIVFASSSQALADYLLPFSGQLGSFYVTYPDKVYAGGHYSVGFHYQGKGKYIDAALNGDKYAKVTNKYKTTINGQPTIVFFVDIDKKAPVGSTIYLKAGAIAGDNVLVVKERNGVNLGMQVVCSPGTTICFN